MSAPGVLVNGHGVLNGASSGSPGSGTGSSTSSPHNAQQRVPNANVNANAALSQQLQELTRAAAVASAAAVQSQLQLQAQAQAQAKAQSLLLSPSQQSPSPLPLAPPMAPPIKRSLSRSAPTSPMARAADVAPMSTITPMDLAGSSAHVNGAAAASGSGSAYASGSASSSASSSSSPRHNGHSLGHSVNGNAVYVNGTHADSVNANANGHAIGSSSAATDSLGLAGARPLIPASTVPGMIPMDARTHTQLRARYSPEASLRPLSPLSGNVPLPVTMPLGSQAARTLPQRGASVPQPQTRQQPQKFQLQPALQMPPPQLPPQVRRRAPASVSSAASTGSSSSSSTVTAASDADDTEGDSDTTFVPGRMNKHKHSLSQPNLPSLNQQGQGQAPRHAVENWTDNVRRQTLQSQLAGNNLTRRRSNGRRTPPARNAQLGVMTSTSSSGSSSSTSFGTSPLAHGHGHVRHSPRQSTSTFPMITPIWPATASESSGSESPNLVRSPQGGMTGSEDADDDHDTDSLSDGSLSFLPRSRGRGVTRPRSLPGDKLGPRALGLSLEPSAANSADEATTPRRIDLHAASIEARLQRSSLLSFRLLAIVPAIWGIAVLVHALVAGTLWNDVWPWGVDFSREALERLIAGEIVDEGIRLPIHRGDMVLAIGWAWLTGHFCFGLTTGLTHRWRNYYSLPSTVTRLVSLQCLCWPATYLTLHVLGPRRPLLAWVIIGVTTGCSRTVQMWVTSNVIVDTPPGSVSGDPGDVTPGPFTFGRVSPPQQGVRRRPQHLRGWRVFTHNRRWSWDLVARKVGWKIGAMLLVTCAWLFWRLENESPLSPLA